MFIFTKSLLFYPVDYVPYTGRRFTVSYEMKTNAVWIYSASYFANVEGAQGFIVGCISIFSRVNGKLQRPIRAKKDIYCLDTAEFNDRVCSVRGMNKDESKVKVGINYGKSFLNLSAKTMVDYLTDFKLHHSSPPGSAFKFSGAKRMLLQAPEIHLNRQQIVYLAKINEILDYIFTAGLEMHNLMGSLFLLLLLHLKSELVNLQMDVRFGFLKGFLLQSLASFGKNIMKVRSKYASVHAYHPMLTSASCICGMWCLNKRPLRAEPLSQATYYLSRRGQRSMPTQVSIPFVASTNSIRVYLGSRLTLGTWR